MHHSLHGRGPLRVMALHGWFADRTAFDSLLPALDPEAFTVALPDYRGYGEARSSGGPYDVGTIAADVIELADALGWDRFTVVGHSMGGKVALRIAADAPDRVERIVGITPVWAGAAPFDPETLAFFRMAADSRDTRQAIINLTTGGRLPAVWTRSMADKSMQISDRDAFAGYFESWGHDDFAEAARDVRQEVLVVAGGHDRGVPEELLRATWIAGLPGARLVVMPEAGHYPIDECPLILGATIADFIERAAVTG